MFISPMLLHKSDEPFNDSEYLTELKLDGIRFEYTVDLTGKVRMYSRHKNEVTSRFPELLSLNIPPGTILDGEIIVSDKDGKPDFEAMMEKFMSSKSDAKVSYVVFDVLMYQGKSVRNLPLLKRKEILAEIIPVDTPLLSKVQFIEGHGKEYFDLVKAQSLEGIVLKKKNTKYEANKRSHSWLKVINYQYATVFVHGYRKDEFGWLLSNSDGKYLGIMELGASKEPRKIIYSKPVIKDTDSFKHIEPVKCKVKFRNYTKKGLLRLPSFVEFV